ncbi:hypothetical protein BH10CHL1_BH10CHL1_16580 [soil metagenome]
MTSSRYPQITDELLSAYIDDAVTKEEKALIETAIIDEPAIAWRLETLRYTINLLSSLPAVALPRSFALSEMQATGHIGAQTAAQSGRSAVAAQEPAWRINAGLHSLIESWQNFWQLGNLFLRNATAVSLAVFLALVFSNELITKPAFPSATMNRQSAPNVATMRSNERANGAQKISPTAIAQALTVEPSPVAATANAANDSSQALAQPTMASQAEAANRAPAPANEAVGAVSSQADNSSATSTTAAEAPVVAAAAAPQPDAARSSTANQYEDAGAPAEQPGPDNGVLGDDGLAPPPPTTNGPAMPPSAAPSMQGAAPQTAASGIQSATNSPLTKQQMTATLTKVVTSTLITTTATSILVYNSQSQATPEATQTERTLTPSATGIVTNNRAEAVQPATTAQATSPLYQWSWLSIAQLLSAFVTLILGALWWRSGEAHYPMNRQQR